MSAEYRTSTSVPIPARVLSDSMECGGQNVNDRYINLAVNLNNGTNFSPSNYLWFGSMETNLNSIPLGSSPISDTASSKR